MFKYVTYVYTNCILSEIKTVRRKFPPFWIYSTVSNCNLNKKSTDSMLQRILFTISNYPFGLHTFPSSNKEVNVNERFLNRPPSTSNVTHWALKTALKLLIKLFITAIFTLLTPKMMGQYCWSSLWHLNASSFSWFVGVLCCFPSAIYLCGNPGGSGNNLRQINAIKLWIKQKLVGMFH